MLRASGGSITLEIYAERLGSIAEAACGAGSSAADRFRQLKSAAEALANNEAAALLALAAARVDDADERFDIVSIGKSAAPADTRFLRMLAEAWAGRATPCSPEIDPELFAQALRSIGEPIIDRKAADIPMSRLLQQLFDVTAQFGMETREELLLLQRTMVAVEGVARSLDPDFDMWAAARPEVERYVAENLGPRAALSDLRAAGMTLARLGPRLPRLAERLAEMANGSAPPIAVRMAEPPQQRGGFWNGVLAGALGASLLLGAYLLGAAV